MNQYQQVYLIAMVLLIFPAWKRQRYALGCLWANLVATLAACLAMDLEVLGRTDATLSMMLIDFASGIALAMRPGLPRVLAWGYAITIPWYAAATIWELSPGATYGILYIVASAQVLGLAIGSVDSGGGGLHRRAVFSAPLELSRGNNAVSVRPVPCDPAGNSGV